MGASVKPGGVIEIDGPIGDGAGGFLLKYDPAKVLLIFGALPLTQGIVKGTFISVERSVKSWKLHKGIDGEGARTRTHNFSARVTLTIGAGSWINDALSHISGADDITGTMISPLTLKDTNGRSISIAPIAFLESPVDPTYSDEEGERAWTFICDSWLPFTGGLDRASPAS